MKTYEKFIASNLFRKRKELPREVRNFGDVLCLFLNNHMEMDWTAGIREYQPEDKKKDSIIYIYFDPNTMDGTYNFINLYYNSKTKELMIAILPQPKNKELVDIQNFLEYVIDDYKEHRTNYLTTMKEGTRIWIKLDSIPEICQKLNSEEFELFTNANKYNL